MYMSDQYVSTLQEIHMVPEFFTEKIPDDRSIIVISDTHLGGVEGPETINRISNFLDTIHAGQVTVVCQGEESGEDHTPIPKHLLPPTKIILIGDILDLWNPRLQDRNYAFIDSLILFLKLRDIPSDIIYVTGNHDEDSGEPVYSYGAAPPDRTNPAYHIYSLFKGLHGKVESLKIAWTGEHILEISPRHYPASSTKGHVRGLNAGGIHYVFVHGQQFDKQQVTYTIGQAIGCRFDIIDSIEEILNCSIIREVRKSLWIQSFIGIYAILTILTFILPVFHMDIFATRASWLVGITVAGTFFAIFVKGIELFGFTKKDLPSSPLLFKVCLGLALCEIIFLGIGTWFFSYGILDILYKSGIFAFFFLLFIFIIPLLYGYLSTWMYSTFFSAKNYDVQGVYEDALKSEKYTYNAEVLIFGHTHISGTYPNTDEDITNMGPSYHGKPTLLINTGAWVRNIYGIDDSFAYIDTSGAALMKWNDATRQITCTKYFPKETIKRRSYF